MDVLHSDTVTLFNHYKSQLGDLWYPSILRGVHLNMDKAAIMAKYGAESDDTVILNVPYTVEDGKKVVCGKTWLPPKEWDRQTNDLLPDSLTFTSGQSFDFFWVGEWTGAAQISEDDYLDSFYGYMRNNNDYVFAISSVGGPYKLIPHFEITGR